MDNELTMNLLDLLGQHFMPAQARYMTWQSERYVLYVVPQNFKL
jgi:hypothetical protein